MCPVFRLAPVSDVPARNGSVQILVIVAIPQYGFGVAIADQLIHI